ncbi:MULTISPECIES: SDR family oxidoreductase [unclassified Halomonas]|uniref:SDR family NAD(P)-dependent oxidoreductase n=1 Tax=unclassified Halomonas TaxID=2609666 RepID=UPI0007D994DA|nr:MULTISPECIES: SDR family oxidoreductase [unclassified Halomonas]MBT2788419.1 SDR family oxidoreductase [Halomonas sp. ISL-106]MBT2798010.1 SDR family oxidoreductase [Halomonas sp. ISL-104]OAL60578.1 short-chain dehydrogenase [Halomonas sp. ALS9]
MTTPQSTVLITGASSGFGEEFAKQYAKRGHRLVLVARRLDRLEALAVTLREQYKVDVLVEQVDLSNIAAITDLHARLTEQSVEVDVLINNAGHGLQGPFLDSPLDATMSMIQLDIASLTAMTQVFGQDMRTRKRGQILQIASILAYQGVENYAVYSAAKSYVLRFGEALHREFKRDNVTVTTLCPGLSDTGFVSNAGQRMTPMLRSIMMPAPPVVRAGIQALDAGRISVVAGLANKMNVVLMWATPRRIHQALLSKIMNG